MAGAGVLERPRYYPRQLITPSDMTLEQKYFRDRLRRHNRLLHGWGVVCGAQVCRVPSATQSAAEPWQVRVTPGYILGPFGDEILIEKDATVDLRTGKGAVAGGASDPWCAPVVVKPESGPLYVAVRYEEDMGRPVRVQPGGCGCGDSQCEYSRWTDGYRFGLLSECPIGTQKPPDTEDLMRGLLPSCPSCPIDPWVVLAKVEVDDEGTITAIDNCSCRRMVVSLARAWWLCQNETVTIAGVQTATDALEPGQKHAKLVVTGTGFSEGAQVDLGEGITVNEVKVVSPTRIEIDCDVAAAAAVGTRTLQVTTCCGPTASKADAVKIAAAAREGGRDKRPRRKGNSDSSGDAATR